MAYNKAEKGDKTDAPMRRKGGLHRRKKVCVFCGKDNVIDYKDVNKLGFTSAGCPMKDNIV